jgi:hypothetical protein
MIYITSRSNLTIALDNNCKNLNLRGDEPPANLHVAGRRLDVLETTCTIKDYNRDTIFVNEVQLKPISRGMTTGALPQYHNTGRFRIPASRRLPPVSLSLCLHGYNSNPPLIFMRRLGLQSRTQTLPYSDNTTHPS